MSGAHSPERLPHAISVAESDYRKAEADLARDTSESFRKEAEVKRQAAAARLSQYVTANLHHGLEVPPLGRALDAPEAPQVSQLHQPHSLFESHA